MKKFSNTNLDFNPYTEPFKNEMYSVISKNLKSNKGKIYGMEDLVEKIDNLLKEEIKEYNIQILEDIKDGILESEEKIEYEDDFSSQINSMKDDTKIEDNEEDSIVTKGRKESDCEPLTEGQVNDFIKKLNS
jgi:hypothetical protein